MINNFDKDVLRLVARSPDRGDGWRTVSDVCWPLIESFTAAGLLEIDEHSRRVRLTNSANVLLDYAL